jgi:hypothetical protein
MGALISALGRFGLGHVKLLVVVPILWQSGDYGLDS